MPLYRGVKISVISQLGAQALPEYRPQRIFDHDILSPAPNSLPALLDASTNTTTVYIPIFPNSTFWFQYQVYAPGEHAFFYFKAYINGNQLVSFGTGEADNYEGQIMFGLFETDRTENMHERRLLGFTENSFPDQEGSALPGEESLEIRVYHAKGRRPDGTFNPVYSDKWSAQAVEREGRHCRDSLVLRPGGELPSQHPSIRYEYSLVEDIDEPFATFRWLPRTWAELERLGVAPLAPPSNVRASLAAPIPINRPLAGPIADEELAGPASASSEDQAFGPVPDRTEGEGSPLRVPVYEPSRNDLELPRTPIRRSVSDGVLIAEHSSTGEVRGDENTEQPSGLKRTARFSPLRERVLEPRNELDRIATARPANRGDLLESVVSHMQTPSTSLQQFRPGSPDSQKALHDYLHRRPSEKTVRFREDGTIINPTEAARARAYSCHGLIEGDDAIENLASVADRPPTPFRSASFEDPSQVNTHEPFDRALMPIPANIFTNVSQAVAENGDTDHVDLTALPIRTTSLSKSKGSSKGEEHNSHGTDGNQDYTKKPEKKVLTIPERISSKLRGGFLKKKKSNIHDEILENAQGGAEPGAIHDEGFSTGVRWWNVPMQLYMLQDRIRHPPPFDPMSWSGQLPTTKREKIWIWVNRMAKYMPAKKDNLKWDYKQPSPPPGSPTPVSPSEASPRKLRKRQK